MQSQQVCTFIFVTPSETDNYFSESVFVSLSVCLSVQLGQQASLMLVLCVMATALFYMAHWQTYVTGELRFAKFDVTEAQMTIIVIQLMSAIFGSDIWTYEVLS